MTVLPGEPSTDPGHTARAAAISCPYDNYCHGSRYAMTPNAAGYAGSNDPKEGPFNFEDLIFKASPSDKLWRGFVLGCALGVFVAALCCCWAPCFRHSRRGGNHGSTNGDERAVQRRSRRSRMYWILGRRSAEGTGAREENDSAAEGRIDQQEAEGAEQRRQASTATPRAADLRDSARDLERGSWQAERRRFVDREALLAVRIPHEP